MRAFNDTEALANFEPKKRMGEPEVEVRIYRRNYSGFVAASGRIQDGPFTGAPPEYLVDRKGKACSGGQIERSIGSRHCERVAALWRRWVVGGRRGRRA